MRNDELRGERVIDDTERWLDAVPGDSIQNDAVDWLLRLQSSSASPDEKTAFLAWMDRDARHVVAFAEIFWASYRVWSTANAHLAEVKEWMEHRYSIVDPTTKQSSASSRRRVYAIAASVAIIASIVATLVHLGIIDSNIAGARSARTQIFDTQIGENRTVVLEDASRVTLGGRTRVEVTLSKRQRAVTLYEGEAFFEVAKERARSFTVQAGPVKVTAVGTAFNINRSNDSSVVTVTEGSVLVTPMAQGSKARKVRLTAGEQTTATNSGVGTPIVVPDLPAVLSWPTGRLSFRGRLLREAVDDVNRYTSKPIVLAPEVGDIVVTGTLMINNVGSWVKSLERAFDLKAIEENDRIVLAASTANR